MLCVSAVVFELCNVGSQHAAPHAEEDAGGAGGYALCQPSGLGSTCPGQQTMSVAQPVADCPILSTFPEQQQQQQQQNQVCDLLTLTHCEILTADPPGV